MSWLSDQTKVGGRIAHAYDVNEDGSEVLGTLVAIHTKDDTADVRWDDGDFSAHYPEDFLRFAADAPPRR